MNTPAFTLAHTRMDITADDPRDAKLALIGGRLVYNPGHAVARLPRWIVWLQGVWSRS